MMQELDSLKAKLQALKSERRACQDLAETLKITSNGSFGKFGSPYSVLFSPNLLIQTTVTGQLALLMLIEEFELAGMKVISANTDGVVTKVPRTRRKTFESIIKDWEWETGLETEETEYLAIHSRDVNNYIAIPSKGDVKLKGSFSKGGPGLKGAMGMKKNPTNEVCIDAVINYLKEGKPLIETIRECTDIRQFITIRKVNGGAVKDGDDVGKVIRFYYAQGVTGTITYKKTGNDVPKTEGAKPLMVLPDDFPDDVDYSWYLREATAMLQDLGHRPVDPKFEGRKGFTVARLDDQKTYHRLKLPHGIAACGKAPESLRERWHEVVALPDGERMCSKCRKEWESW